MSRDGEFEYSSDMKDHYKSETVAQEYHNAYSKNGSWRHRLIANRERNAIETLLQKVPHDTVLDIPTGTGKLAPVFAKTESDVLACDISPHMLEIAEEEYDRAGVDGARFQQCNAEEITETISETFDVAVSLRLLHRVPADLKREILQELGAVGEYVIASTGVETRFQRFRRTTRKRLIGGDERDHCYESPEETKEIFSDGFEIIDSKAVLPVLSQEYVYLLKPLED